MTETISIRAPKDILDRLEEVAKATDRNRTYHIIKAIEYYIDEYADLMIALDRLSDPTDKIVSMQEIKNNLEISS
jgi:predicted DNA-binding protein